MPDRVPYEPSPVVTIVYLAILLLTLVGLWKTFTKAGLPGWGVIVPFYNLYLFVKLAGRPGWWLILLFIPLLNVVIDIVLSIDIARKFGGGAGFGIGLFFLPFIFFPVLAFGDARYEQTGPPVLPTTPV